MQWLNDREKRQASAFKQYVKGKLSVRESQERSGLSESTFWRRLKRYRAWGALSLGHQLRGRRSNRDKGPVRMKVLQEWDVLPPKRHRTVRSFYLLIQPRRPVGYSTVRKWLRDSGRLSLPLYKRSKVRTLSPKSRSTNST